MISPEKFLSGAARSVVINRGDPTGCPVKDQSGNPRVGSCDIGAVEFQEITQVAIGSIKSVLA